MNKKIIFIVAIVIAVISVIAIAILFSKEDKAQQNLDNTNNVNANNISNSDTQPQIVEEEKKQTPLVPIEINTQIDDKVKELENDPENPVEVDKEKLEESKEELTDLVENKNVEITDVTGVEENGAVSFSTTSGSGITDPDDTSMVVAEDMTPEEAKQVEEEYKEKSVYDENDKELTQEELTEAEKEFIEWAKSQGLNEFEEDTRLDPDELREHGTTDGWYADYR